MVRFIISTLRTIIRYIEHLHSNMVRFIIKMGDAGMVVKTAFTFQYG